jgi:NitT/TauT family transport system substrate-binding protein
VVIGARGRPLAWLALLGALLLAGCGGPAATAPAARPADASAGAAGGATTSARGPAATATPEPVRLTVPYSPISGSTTPFWLAIDEGLFARQGLEIDAQFVGGSSAIIQAMTGGQYPIGLVGGGDVILNRLSGGDLLMVSTHNALFTIEAYAKPEIRSIADLKGKTIVVTRLGTSTYFAALSMLEYGGLRPEDVAFIQSGGVSESAAVLMAGQADAGMMGYPAGLRAQQAGFPQLISFTKLGDYGLFPTAGTGLSAGWLREPRNRDLALRYLRAFHQGLQMAKQDDAAALRVLRKYTQTDDEALLQTTLDYYRAYFPDTLRVTERGILNALRVADHPAAKDADPKQFYDNSLVDQIERESR